LARQVIRRTISLIDGLSAGLADQHLTDKLHLWISIMYLGHICAECSVCRSLDVNTFNALINGFITAQTAFCHCTFSIYQVHIANFS